jgi:hypothetical protein
MRWGVSDAAALFGRVQGQQINIFFEKFDFLRSTHIKLLTQQKEIQ